MATMRSSRVSRARYTSPMPPAPIGEMISYGPSRVEGWRDTAVACSLPHQSAVWNSAYYFAPDFQVSAGDAGSGRPAHFFNPAVQFWMTAISDGGPEGSITRNRLPSGETS